MASTTSDNNGAGSTAGDKVSYPDLASPTDSVIAGDFGAMSPEEQERQRDEWKEELRKTEEEILTLKQVLASKEMHAAGLKRRLGITAWREFSEDMTQGLRAVQESAAYKRAGEVASQAKEKAAGVWGAVAASQGFQSVTGRMGSAFGAAKSKISASMSTQNVGEVPNEEGKEADGGVSAAENGSGDAAKDGEKK